MEALQNLLSGENGSAIQLVLITLILVIVLILVVWIFRRVAGSPSRRAARNRVPRLSITDSAAVDDKRYLVLVRRDNVEHLVLIGGPTDVVVESGIMRVQPATKTDMSPRQEAAPQQEEIKETPPPQPDPVPGAVPVAATAATVAAVAVATDTEEPTVATEPEPPATDSAMVENTAEIEAEEIIAEPVIEETVPEEIPEAVSESLEEALTELEITELSVDDSSDMIDPEPEMQHAEEEMVEANPQPEPELEPEPTEPVAIEEPSIATPDSSSLEEVISAQLDDALSSDDFSVEPAGEPSSSSSSEDEMQRLLDELSGNSKD